MAAQRRLSAILHADIAGFVRLMEGAELGTVRHLKSAQKDVCRPAIERGGGRLVNSPGDAMLAEFGSVVAAVGAAIDIQEGMAQFNQMLEAGERLLFRIGVHVGEVIVDDGDADNIFGDGVNLAARIQTVAEPGGIAVSELGIDYAFVDGGEHRLKHVSRPVHIFHVRARAAASIRTTTSTLPKATLRFQGNDLAGYSFGFELALDRLMTKRDGVVIGRDAGQCDVAVVHSTVSRRHARLSFTADGLQVEDLGSKNGTWVDGLAARPGTRLALQAGAKLKIGEIELAFRQV